MAMQISNKTTMKKITLFLVFLISAISVCAQTSIYGKVNDKESGEELIGASLVLTKNGVFITGAASDFDGN